MRPTNTMMRTILILACALVAGLAIYPATVGAQAVKDEYDLGKLPQANGDNEKSAIPGAASDSDDGEGGASPVLLIVLGIAALACLSIAAWWIRRNREGGQGPGGTSATSESTSQAPSSP